MGKATNAARRWGRNIFSQVNLGRVLDSAAAASFWLFLALIPIAAVTFMITMKVAASNASVLSSLLYAVPPQSRAFVTHELEHVRAWNGGAVAPISGIVFVWLASSGVQSILDAFDATLDAERPWWKKRLLAIAISIGFSVAVALVAFGFGMLGSDFVRVVTRTPARYVAAIVGEFVFIVALFWVGIPRNAKTKTHRWPGAIVAVVLQGFLGWGYITYLRTLGSGSAYTSATLATIGATMTMVYLFTLALLIGVAFNAIVARRRDKDTEQAPAERWSGAKAVRPAHESS